MENEDNKLAEEILKEKGFFVMTHKEGSEHVRKAFIEPVIKAMQAYHKAKMKEEVRKCVSCGSPLNDYCERCQHLMES